jgi:hypothetical protein
MVSPTCWVGCCASAGLPSAVGVLHAVLEALDGAAEILADVTQLLGTENEHDDDQNDQPVPNGKTAHGCLLDSLEHGADRFRSAHDVNVQMRHFLLPDTTIVDDDTKAVGTTFGYRISLALASMRPSTGHLRQSSPTSAS